MRSTEASKVLIALAASLAFTFFLSGDYAYLISDTLIAAFLLFALSRFTRKIRGLREGLSLERVLPSRIAPYSTLSASIRLTNRSSKPISIAELGERIPEGLEELEDPSLYHLSLAPNSEYLWRRTLRATKEGTYLFERVKVKVSDSLGLFTEEVFIDTPGEVEVQVPVRGSHAGYTLDLQPLRKGRGVDYAGTRPYLPGDAFRSIEWKATARHGKFMTKEYYLEMPSTIRILLQASPSMVRDALEGPLLYRLMPVLFSLGELMMGRQDFVGFTIFDAESVKFDLPPTRSRRELWKALEAMKGYVPPVHAEEHSRGQDIVSGADLVKRVRELERTVARREGTQTDRLLPFYVDAKASYRRWLQGRVEYRIFSETGGTEPSLYILVSDLSTRGEATLDGAKVAMARGDVVVMAVVGEPWREGPNLEEAYLEYQKVGRIAKIMAQNGIHVIRTSPELLLQRVLREVSLFRVLNTPR